MLLLILVGIEIASSILFWIKDVSSDLIKVDTTVDAPYSYYSFAPQADKSINADGLYSRYGRTKDPKSFRIILIGGSVARSYGASGYDHTISSDLERVLRDRTGRKIDVVNAGMSGFVAEQQFIMLQRVLQFYSPDMVVSLDGANDLEGYRLNRYSGQFDAPANWRDFHVIEMAKDRASLTFRIRTIFKNTARAADFIGRVLRHQNQYDFRGATAAELQRAASTYLQTVQDTHDFLRGKGVAHVAFLQPVRWYQTTGPVVRQDPQAEQKLGELYRLYDDGMKKLPYGNSLTDAMDGHRDLHIDWVHVNDEGNRILASRIADVIQTRMTAGKAQ